MLVFTRGGWRVSSRAVEDLVVGRTGVLGALLDINIYPLTPGLYATDAAAGGLDVWILESDLDGGGIGTADIDAQCRRQDLNDHRLAGVSRLGSLACMGGARQRQGQDGNEWSHGSPWCDAMANVESVICRFGP